MNTHARFKDPLKTIESFGDRFLVHCPSCARRAHVYGGGAAEAIRFVCTSCGRNDHWQGNRSAICYRWGGRKPPAGILFVGAPVDWYFHHPVWLSISCCGETLWAYNIEHLDYLRNYVSATLRERAPVHQRDGARTRNSSLASRLPAWLRAARNRDRVLAAIEKLREASSL